MPVYGYARVSTFGYDESSQLSALEAAGCEVIRVDEVCPGGDKIELKVLLEALRPGDVLIVTSIDRLAGSRKELRDVVHVLAEQGAVLRTTKEPIGTATIAEFLEMIDLFAEFERNLRRERLLISVDISDSPHRA